MKIYPLHTVNNSEFHSELTEDNGCSEDSQGPTFRTIHLYINLYCPFNFALHNYLVKNIKIKKEKNLQMLHLDVSLHFFQTTITLIFNIHSMYI